jgi:HAD superfamily hydrolase (TIGR01509 family)
MALAAVLFDLDGTLIDSERDNIESVAMAMRKLGKTLSQVERDFIIGHSWRDIYDMLVRNHKIVMPMNDLINIAVDEKQSLIEAHGFNVLPGAVELVKRLFDRGIPLAIASGSSHREVHEAIEGIGLKPYFRVLLGAEDYPAGKPDPAPYKAAMKGLGVGAAGCVVIEDALPGVRSGKSAGAAVVGVEAGNFAKYDLKEAHLVVQTLNDLDDAVFDHVLTLR